MSVQGLTGACVGDAVSVQGRREECTMSVQRLRRVCEGRARVAGRVCKGAR